MSRKRAGEAEALWRGRLESWDASGLSLRAFAQREGLVLQTLWSWKKRLRGTTPIAPRFAPVIVRESSGEATESFELVVRGGMSLRIPAHFDEVTLARLIGVIARS